MKNSMLSAAALDRIIDGLLQNRSTRTLVNATNAMSLIKDVVPIVAAEPTVLEITAPVNICGDVHGQFMDLLRAFQCGGLPPESKYIFLGDYVDRGRQSLEVICLLYALKIKYPNNIFLLRGNHESPEMTEFFGFLQECKLKANMDTWKEFCKSFRYLPIAAVVNEKYFCIHGGITPEITKIDQIRMIKRPFDIPEEGMLANLLWSDPDRTIPEWGPNERGSTICYGPRSVEKFIRINSLLMIIRGHQMAQNGYQFPFGKNKSVVTVFTASKYAGVCDNKAAFMTIAEDLTYTFTTLPSWIPALHPKNERSVSPSTPRKKSPFNSGTPRRLSVPAI